MARMKGHAPAAQVAPAGTASPGTAPADQGTTAGAGTGTDTGAAVGGTATGVTDQGRQQGTGDEKTSALGGKSGPESTDPGTTQTGSEAAVSAGAVHEQKGPGEVAASTSAAPEQKQQCSSAVSQQEGERDDQNVPERSQSGDIGQTRAQGTAEDRPQQMGERLSQQKVDEQCKAEQKGVRQEGGQQSRWAGPGEGRCELIHFQGISTDEGDEQPSLQTAEKSR
ncbi:uncharacterized protein BJ212DRAFT_701766 [Suillus subaureus]|uniref:Uncharacterized protein n=1 Tax=Suillus subaureus TaxID=48587 RepID=A0A9P7EJV0_9AGAM|nr:uncharacterized protein BJ212DRAFT_701766 [Suillus subaureus]KAG1823760.1 hypothetical protein BJ212DRAFT_701766 [Suillus subaureus]